MEPDHELLAKVLSQKKISLSGENNNKVTFRTYSAKLVVKNHFKSRFDDWLNM